MRCKASDTCEDEAAYFYGGINTCYACLYEEIDVDEAISEYIDMHATKLEEDKQ